MSKTKLGGGAASLLGGFTPEQKEGFQEADIELIKANPDQPREYFNEAKLEELAASIKQSGIIQPLLVEKSNLGYLLVAGERRLRAAHLAGLKKVPIVIKNFSHAERLEIALIENIQREDLTAIEQAKAYKQLLDSSSLSHEELAIRIGKSRSNITNTLRLLQLPDYMQQALDEAKFSAGHARALLTLEDKPILQHKLYELMLQEEISVREAETKAKELNKRSEKPKAKVQKPSTLIQEEKKLIEHLGVKIQIKGDEHRGTIAIRYHSKEKLDRIIELLKQSE